MTTITLADLKREAKTAYLYTVFKSSASLITLKDIQSIENNFETYWLSRLTTIL